VSFGFYVVHALCVCLSTVNQPSHNPFALVHITSGTCVNVGCVPKKVMWSAASIADTVKHDMEHYGFSGGEGVKLDFAKLKKRRDDYVKRLNEIYGNGFKSAGVTGIFGECTFVDAHTVEVTGEDGKKTRYTGDKIVIATGGRPHFPPGEGVEEHCISSDGFFDLEELPEVAVVVGAGYIAVELAGVLNSLGSEVHLVVRKGKALREFDPLISDGLDAEMEKAGILIHRNTNGVAKVVLDEQKKKNVTLHSGDVIYGADVVLMAAGRVPNTEDLCSECEWAPNTEMLHLECCGVKVTSRKYIIADEYQNTNVENIYALGDVCGKVELTPMAIAAGRRLADRLFSGKEEHKEAKVSYECVPTVVFSHPVSGACSDYNASYLMCLTYMFIHSFRLLVLVESLSHKQLRSMARIMSKCIHQSLQTSSMVSLTWNQLKSRRLL
jgi:glutathione reductase (NADPH)